MLIDSYLSAAKINLGFILTGGLGAVSLGVLWFVGEIRYEPISAILPIILLLAYVVMLLRNYQYVRFTDSQDKFTFRFAYIHYFFRKKKAIEIPKIALADFKIKRVLFGLRTNIILYQKYKSEIVKYPSVSLTILTAQQIQILENILKQQVALNQKNK